jgi:two-component system cell cycle sensor histidine kinase/response regulator CckA
LLCAPATALLWNRFVNRAPTAHNHPMLSKTPSRILVAALFFGGAAWVLDALLSSLFFQNAAFLELLSGDLSGQTLYTRSLLLSFLFLFGLYAGTLVSKLESKHEACRLDQKEKYEALEQSLKKQNLESIGLLAGGFAHEFNNILQGMTGSAYLAGLQSGEAQNPVQEHLEDIHQSGVRAAKLCDQMLMFAGKKSIRLKDLCVDNHIRAVEDELKKIAGDISLTLSLAAPDILIGGDTGLFNDLLQNTLRNAVEACGHPANSLSLSTCTVACGPNDFEGFISGTFLKPGTYLEMRVTDSGPGIPPELNERVFEPFYTTKNKGRGLGLSEVVGIVRAFSGGVNVSSVVNSGTTFTFRFPVRKAETTPETRPASLPSPTGQGLIWIVDDEALITQTLKRVLSRWGFSVLTADRGEVFLDQLTTTAHECSCILLDLTMPVISGADIYDALRETYPNIPVVIMSGYSEEQSISKFSPDTIAGFLHKPFSLEALEETLRNVLPPDAWSK